MNLTFIIDGKYFHTSLVYKTTLNRKVFMKPKLFQISDAKMKKNIENDYSTY